MRTRPLRLARAATRVSVGDLVGTMRERAASLPQAQRQVAALMRRAGAFLPLGANFERLFQRPCWPVLALEARDITTPILDPAAAPARRCAAFCVDRSR